eukprot:15437947-Alexandrium_andersonii.AAC.1
MSLLRPVIAGHVSGSPPHGTIRMRPLGGPSAAPRRPLGGPSADPRRPPVHIRHEDTNQM